VLYRLSRHRHRYREVLAPSARLRAAVTATAGPAGTVLQETESARGAMGLASREAHRRPASRSWALLLAQIYENRPLQCSRCGDPLRILAPGVTAIRGERGAGSSGTVR